MVTVRISKQKGVTGRERRLAIVDRCACTHALRTRCRKVKGTGGQIDRAGGSTSVLPGSLPVRRWVQWHPAADRTIGLGTITRNNIKANAQREGTRQSMIASRFVKTRKWFQRLNPRMRDLLAKKKKKFAKTWTAENRSRQNYIKHYRREQLEASAKIILQRRYKFDKRILEILWKGGSAKRYQRVLFVSPKVKDAHFSDVKCWFCARNKFRVQIDSREY